MKPSKHNVESLLLEIHEGITGLNVEEDFRHSLLEDIELAVECFKEKNILSVIHCLLTLVDKLQTHMILSCCHNSEIEKLLLRSHHLQQILIRLPVCIIGPTGATGPAGPMGLIGADRPAEPPGLTEPTGPVGPAGTTTIIAGSAPVSCFPIPVKASAKSGYFDFSTHVIIYCNSHRKR